MEVTVGPTGSYSTIEEALKYAWGIVENETGNDTDVVLTLESGVTLSGMNNTNLDLTFFNQDRLTIRGDPSVSRPVIECNYWGRFFYIYQPSVNSTPYNIDVHVEDIVIRNCLVSSNTTNATVHYGGAIFVYSNFTSIYFNNVLFEGNSASEGNGGALALVGPNNVNNGQMMNVTGGPINVFISNCKFTNNSSPNDEGVLFAVSNH